jgi:hypothetical protein
MGIDSVTYVQPHGNGSEKGNLITSVINLSPSRLYQRISCDAELVAGFVNRDILIVINAA